MIFDLNNKKLNFCIFIFMQVGGEGKTEGEGGGEREGEKSYFLTVFFLLHFLRIRGRLCKCLFN